MHTGKLDIHNNIVSRSIRRVPGVDLFTRLEFLDMNQTLFTEEDIFLSGIFIPEDQLTNLFGMHISDNFFKSLNLNMKNNFAEFRLPQFLSNKIATCILGHLEGDMRLLFATSAIIQYLLEANIYITNSNKLVIDLGKDDFDVTSLYAELVNVTSEIPKIDELAKKYNVSTVKLNQSFIKKYNQSIYNFLTNQRLEQAYQALLNTDIAMKTLAHKINYSHVNHFITAFKKKFGVTPGSLRRRDKE
jgi:AraC-like DNA-binding protein